MRLAAEFYSHCGASGQGIAGFLPSLGNAAGSSPRVIIEAKSFAFLLWRMFAMATGSFDDFVQREIDAARKSGSSSFDWEREKEHWLRHLNDLHQRIAAFLKPYIDARQISISTSSIEIVEEHISSYLAPQLSIRIGSKTVTLEPIGTVQVGSRGRVDVTCNLERAQIILVESSSVAQLLPSSGLGKPQASTQSLGDGRWVWRIVTRDTVDFTRENFQALLVGIAKG
jgi:hypothetical protein